MGGADNEGQSLTSLPYLYNKLPSPSHIRLLRRLKEGPDHTPSFSIALRDIKDDKGPQYHCLSYTWGNPYAHGTQFKEHFNSVGSQYQPAHTTPIIVDGRILQVQKNLFDALGSIPRTAYVDDLDRPTQDSGKAAMHFAAAAGRVGYIALWIRRGASVHLLDDRRRAPLHYAAEMGHASCVEVLCRGGARREAEDNDGLTPKDLARAAGHDAIVSTLEALAARPDPEPSTIPREPDGPENLIWADAICINQGDVDEKSTQVSMMDRIYSEASFVVAWLGPEDKHTQAGIKTLATLAAHTEAFQKGRITPYGGHDPERYAEAGVPLIDWPDWVGLASIFQRQWFRRAWIVQESMLPGALIMYLGGHLISWRDLGTVSQMLRYKEAELGTLRSGNFVPLDEVAIPVEWNMAEMFKWRTNMNMTRRKDPETEKAYRALFTLEQLVESFWTFHASDPKDKVFSLHGILNAFESNRLETDYRQPVAGIYTRAARKIIREAGNLGILSDCIYAKQRRDGLPSWVPDFALPGVNSIPRSFSADEGLTYQKPDDSTGDGSILKVRGLRIGSISQAGGRRGTGPGDKLRFDPSWLKLALSLRIPGTSEDGKPVLSEILWRTLCMNMSYGSFFDPAKFGPQAPDEFDEQFMVFILLMIQAYADRKVLEKLGVEPSLDRGLTVSRVPYNPFDEDLVSILEDLDALRAHDGDKCCAPPREIVVSLWGSLQYTLARTTTANADGSPVDVYLPEDVMSGEARVVGNGTVNNDTKLFSKCRGFSTAYWMAYGGRQLFTVDYEYMGMGPLLALAGDEVWILPGLRSPAILRPVTEPLGQRLGKATLQDTAQRYYFVGTSYVHGLMRGEAVRKHTANTDMVDIHIV